MKKLGLLIMPLLAVSFLSNCGCSKTEPTYSITFKNDGDTDKKIENIKAGSVVTGNIPTPSSREGYTFIGWCTDTESKYLFDFSKIKIYQDYTLYSGWKENKPVVCTVTFDADEGEFPNGAKTITLDVESNTNVVSAIKTVGSPIKSETKFAYFTYSDGSNITYEDKINDSIILKAKYINSTLDELDWYEIKHISIAGHPRDYFHIGETKRVQLKQQDSKGDGADVISDGEKYQTVRIIDFDKDYIDLDDKSKGEFGITFEFKDLISDSKGNSLSTMWLDSNNGNSDDYENSTIRKLLNGTGGATHFLWAEKEAEGWSDDYKEKTVVSMLPDKLDKNIAITPKYIEHKKNGNEWTDIVVKDKLFLLSIRENGYDDPPQESPEHTSTYEFYKGHTIDRDSIRIKKQINDVEFTQVSTIPPSAGHEGDRYSLLNYAGYNHSSGGGYYWLRTPMRMGSDPISPLPVAWAVEYDGYNNGYHVCTNAFAVAPAFCI